MKKVNLWISQQFIFWPNNHIMHLFHESLHIFINTWKKSTCEYLSNSYYDQIIISTTTNAPAVMSTSTPMFWQRNCPMLTLWYASRHYLGLVALRKSWTPCLNIVSILYCIDLIIHCNRYTEYCHSVNKYPLLPSVKPTKKT